MEHTRLLPRFPHAIVPAACTAALFAGLWAQVHAASVLPPPWMPLPAATDALAPSRTETGGNEKTATAYTGRATLADLTVEARAVIDTGHAAMELVLRCLRRPRSTSRGASIAAGLLPLRGTPRFVCVCLDTSGSMRGYKRERICALLAGTLDELQRRGSEIALVTYAVSPRRWTGPGGPTGPGGWKSVLQGVEWGGAGNMEAALEAAAGLFHERGVGAGDGLLIIASDGRPTLGEKDPGKLGALLRSIGCELRIISTGIDDDHAFLERLARESGASIKHLLPPEGASAPNGSAPAPFVSIECPGWAPAPTTARILRRTGEYGWKSAISPGGHVRLMFHRTPGAVEAGRAPLPPSLVLELGDRTMPIVLVGREER